MRLRGALPPGDRPPCTARPRGGALALLLALALALPACGTVARLRARLRPAPPEPAPVLIPLDPYTTKLPPLSSALPQLPLYTPEGVADRVARYPELLAHLRKIGAEYTGRRLPPLRWTVQVRRIEPAQEGEKRRAGFWDVRVVSSSVRGSQLYYQCDLGFSFAGEPLRGGRPSQLCGWRDSAAGPARSAVSSQSEP